MNPHRKTRFRPDVDRLDVRALLTSGVSAGLVNGVLSIAGTGAADVISLNFRGRGPRAVVSVAGVPGTRFRASMIHEIDIAGGAGNDTIAINDNGRFALPARIDGGDGDDAIFSGSGRASISGGAGNDKIWASSASVVDAGSGTNTVNGVTTVAPTPAPVVTTTSTGSNRTGLTLIPVNTSTGATTSTPTTTTPVVTTPPATLPPATPAPTPDQVVQSIIALTNQDRVANGLAPLTVNAKMMQAAQIHANDMARFDEMEHTLPDAAAPTIQSRADAVGYTYSYLGENIAYNFSSAGAVEAGWMNSTGHRANILNTNYTDFGVAIAYNAKGEPYYSVEFGRPA